MEYIRVPSKIKRWSRSKMDILKLILQIIILAYIGFIVLCLGIATYLNLAKKEETKDEKIQK